MADEKDDLLGDIRAAMEGTTADAPETAAEAPAAVEPGPAPVERARDESGRFAKTADDKSEGEKRPTLSLKEKPETQGVAALKADVPPSPSAPSPAPEPGKEPIAPPVEWKGGGKIKWDRLPREIQTELRGAHDALAAERATVAPFRELIDSHRDLLVRESGSVENGMRELMAFARLSVDNPVALIQHIARARGIDLRQAVGQPQPAAGAPTPQTPDIASLIEQAVQAKLQPHLAQQAERETQQINQTVEAFRADPKHPYFEDVRVPMGHLLRAGLAKDMQDAYDQATWANPTIRAQLQSSAAEEAQRTQAAEAQRARQAAAASLRGSPLSGASTNGAGNPNSTAHDDVRAAMAELSGA